MFCNFVLFFTLTLIFSIYKKKIEQNSGGTEAPQSPPRSSDFYWPADYKFQVSIVERAIIFFSIIQNIQEYTIATGSQQNQEKYQRIKSLSKLQQKDKIPPKII